MHHALFLAGFGLLVLCAPARAADYTLVGEAWTCQGQGMIADVEAGRASDKQIQVNSCMPAFQPQPANVIAFQGNYAFLCDKLKGGFMPTFNCTYALTRDLRDKSGKPVPPHFSKASPSPHFFDAP